MSKDAETTVEKLPNPFRAQQRRGNEDTLKFCAWEVLKGFPQGLHISDIVKEVQERGLRDLSRMKNANVQISSKLARAKDAFFQASGREIWWIRPLAPAGLVEATQTTEEQLPKGDELKGHRVAVWWKGEREFFEGVIRSFDEASQSYAVVYDDGDTDDGLEFRKYTVEFKESKIAAVRVLEHNLDDVDETSSQPKGTVTSKDEGSEWSFSTGQAACSADSTTGAEFSESTPRKDTKRLRERITKTVTSKDGQGVSSPTEVNKPVLHLPTAMDRDTAMPDAGPPVDAGLAHLKRKNDLSAEETKKKKTRVTEQGDDSLKKPHGEEKLLVSASHTSARLSKDLTHGAHVKATLGTVSPIANEGPPVVVTATLKKREDPVGTQPSVQMHVPEEKTVTDVASISKAKQEAPAPEDSAVSLGKTRTHRVETINVLDLTRQLKPPEDKRPDLKKLTDVGELMSLSELSDELRLIADGGDHDPEEITSKISTKPIVPRKQEGHGIELQRTHETQRRGVPAAKLDKPAMRMEVRAATHSEPVFRTRPSIYSMSSRQQQGQRIPMLHNQQRVMPMPSASHMDRSVIRGRELLSPSILSKQQSAIKLDKLPTTVPFVTGATHRAAGFPSLSTGSETRIQTPIHLSSSIGGCPSTQSNSMVMREAGPFHESSGVGRVCIDSFSRNNEAAGHSVMFESATFQSRRPTDKTNAGRGQWKDRFSVGV